MFSLRRWITIALVLSATGPVTLASADSTVGARIGEVWVQTEAGAAPFHKALVSSLKELGYVEGQNLVLLTRYANGDTTVLPSLLKELINLHVDVLFVSEAAVAPAKSATTSVPIVCATMSDPVDAGLVASLSHPGGNLTGVSWQSVDSAPKRFELALELRPKLRRLAVMYGRGNREAQLEAQVVSSAARKAGVTVFTYEVQKLTDVHDAFAAMAKTKPQVLHVVDTGVTVAMRWQIATGALQLHVPMISEGRLFAEAGGVMTYGPRLTSALQRGAMYVDRILKGTKPGDLPIVQPTEFELVVNLKSTKAIALKVPESILNRADEVIRCACDGARSQV